MRAYRLIAKLCAVILLLIVSLGILGVSQMIAILIQPLQLDTLW